MPGPRDTTRIFASLPHVAPGGFSAFGRFSGFVQAGVAGRHPGPAPFLSADSAGAYSIVSFEFRDFPKRILLSKDQNIVPSNGSRVLIIQMDLEASHLDLNPKHCPS